MKRNAVAALVMFALVGSASIPGAATRTALIVPLYTPPAEMADVLGAREMAGRWLITWAQEGADHTVELRFQHSANRVILIGEDADVSRIEALAKASDLPPRQISLEARIVEVDLDKARDLGVDWSRVSTSVRADWLRNSAYDISRRNSSTPFPISSEDRASRIGTSSQLNAGAQLFNALTLLEEKGAATYRDTPRILTVNNRTATILDGERVTYVAKANGYTNQYVTETMDAGLKLEVTPSLGESGYLRLEIEGELTEFTSTPGAAFGAPVKRGQILSNSIVAKDGETLMLGGFTRTVDRRVKRGFPVLGRVLPFLFSREIVQQTHHESIIVITPRVVSLDAGLDAKSRGLLEGK
ncbi:MAG: hypothetical protein ABIU54_13800 [Candidatus Eisenbacteria bacterium]